jgi:hypothetical protein
MQSVDQFTPTIGLTLLTFEGGKKILPVRVCTDITDQAFLQTFQAAVHEAFVASEAARSNSFAMVLNWRTRSPDALYNGRPPKRGAAINLAAHRVLFKGCSLVSTTGAASTHARVGSHIILGTDPINRRTLAHEFGHLLGFSDAYVRGYDGQPNDPYGVVLVEWTGITDDLMGNPGAGRVSAEMIAALIEAYDPSSLQ